MIIATQNHNLTNCSDTNYLIDADLSILGQDYEIYSHYCEYIRKEYCFIDDFSYFNGRLEVLQGFVQMNSIFKTQYFREKFEVNARVNIATEIEILKKKIKDL